MVGYVFTDYAHRPLAAVEAETGRRKAAEERRLLGPIAPVSTGRPSKRDRRLIHTFSGRR